MKVTKETKLMIIFTNLWIIVFGACIIFFMDQPTMAANTSVNNQVYRTQVKQTTWLDVNQDTQLVKIMNGNTAERIIIVSTGKPNTPTPNGVFYTQNKGTFFSVGYASAKYFTSFKGWGKYMFHSILFDSKGRQVLSSAAEKLGSKASHGCIRMPIHDAYWIYKNIPQGTKVIIHSQTSKKRSDKSTSTQKKTFSLNIDGKVVNMHKKSRWVEGILMVPINDLVKLMNSKTVWNSKEVSVLIIRNQTSVKLPISVPRMFLNGKQQPVKIPGLLINKTIWVPFNDTFSALGYQIKWSAEDNQLSAYSSNFPHK